MLRITVYFLDLIDYPKGAAERGAQKMPPAGPLLTPALVANLDAPAGSVAAQQIASGPEIAHGLGPQCFLMPPVFDKLPCYAPQVISWQDTTSVRTMRALPALLIAPRSVLRGTLIVGGHPPAHTTCPIKPQCFREQMSR